MLKILPTPLHDSVTVLKILPTPLHNSVTILKTLITLLTLIPLALL
jgi:hypothetical protein